MSGTGRNDMAPPVLPEIGKREFPKLDICESSTAEGSLELLARVAVGFPAAFNQESCDPDSAGNE